MSAMYSKKRPRRRWPCLPFSPPATSVPSWDTGCGMATYVGDALLGHASAHPKVRYLHRPEDLSEDYLLALDMYRELPFPFEPIGVGCDGKPADMDIEVEMPHNDLIEFLVTFSVVAMARKKAMVSDLVSVVEGAWEDLLTRWQGDLS
ncbi:hypothetical protein VPH35_032629 [Triticum aestivum]